MNAIPAVLAVPPVALGRCLRRGVSLLELMVTLTIGTAVMVVGAPYMSDYVSNSRLRESATVVQTELMFAQSEAMKRNRVVRFTVGGQTVQVLEAQDATTPALIRERQLNPAVAASAAQVEYSPRGYPVDRSTTPLTEFVATSVDLSMVGTTSCSSDVRCPRVVVAGGGGVSVCGNRLDC